MPTTHPRLNVVLEPLLYAKIVDIARVQGISRSFVARDLLKEALELQEDAHWQKSGVARDKTFSSKKALSHQAVWG